MALRSAVETFSYPSINFVVLFLVFELITFIIDKHTSFGIDFSFTLTLCCFVLISFEEPETYKINFS